MRLPADEMLTKPSQRNSGKAKLTECRTKRWRWKHLWKLLIRAILDCRRHGTRSASEGSSLSERERSLRQTGQELPSLSSENEAKGEKATVAPTY